MSTVNERIAKRRKQVQAQRRRTRLRRTVLVALAVGVVVAAVAVERSELVALVGVSVEGTERLDDATVLEAGGLELGTSVLRIRLGRVEREIEALPLVEEATVSRDGALSLRVEVQEVSPVLTAAYPDGTVLLSADGLVLGEGVAPGTPLVVMEGFAPRAGRTWTDLPTLRTAAAVALGLPGPIEALVAHVVGVSPDAVEFELHDGTVVRWGDETEALEKARALGAVLEDLDGASVTAIDVRSPMAPTIVP